MGRGWKRAGDLPGASPPDLRAVLPRRQGAVEGAWGDGPGSLHRETNRRIARRDDPRGEPHRRRDPVHPPASSDLRDKIYPVSDPKRLAAASKHAFLQPGGQAFRDRSNLFSSSRTFAQISGFPDALSSRTQTTRTSENVKRFPFRCHSLHIAKRATNRMNRGESVLLDRRRHAFR